MGVEEGVVKDDMHVARSRKLSWRWIVTVTFVAIAYVLLMMLIIANSTPPVLNGIGQATSLTVQTMYIDYSNGEHEEQAVFVIGVSEHQAEQATEILRQNPLRWMVFSPVPMSEAQVAPLLTPAQKRLIAATAQPHYFVILSNQACMKDMCVGLP